MTCRLGASDRAEHGTALFQFRQGAIACLHWNCGAMSKNWALRRMEFRIKPGELQMDVIPAGIEWCIS